jgi:uncharacterized protein (DUF1778 family)
MKAASCLQKISARNEPVVARPAVDEAHVVNLSERDSLRALDLLANPPAPNARAIAAALALPAQT